MNYTFLQPLIRQGVAAGAGYLVGKGLLADGMANEFIAAAMFFLSYGWSVFQKKNNPPIPAK